MRCTSRGPSHPKRDINLWRGSLGLFHGVQLGGPGGPRGTGDLSKGTASESGQPDIHWSCSQPLHWAGSTAGGRIPAQLGPTHVPVPAHSLPAVVPVAAAVTADETEALKAEITKAVKQVQEAGETGTTGLAPPTPAAQRLPHFCVYFSLPRQTPTRRSFTPAIPAGRSFWTPAAWRSTCASTRPRRSSCSRRSRTSTSPTALRAGRQSRSFPLGSSSSAPATAQSHPRRLLPRPPRPRGRPRPPRDPAQPLFKRQLGNGVKRIFLEGKRWNKMQYFVRVGAPRGGTRFGSPPGGVLGGDLYTPITAGSVVC